MTSSISTTFCVALLMLGARPAVAQPPAPVPSNPPVAGTSAEPTSPGIWTQLGDRLEVRQNTNVKKDIAKPAFITVTNPDAGAATYQVGVGVLASAYSSTLLDVSGVIDIQRNTATDKEQNLFKAGATAGWQLRPIDATTLDSSGLVTFRSQFNRDGVKHTRGLTTAVGYTHLFTGTRRVPHPNAPYRVGDAFEFLYMPLVGLEVHRVFAAETDAAEGTVTRALAQVSTAFYPAPRRLRMKVELLASYAYRADVTDSTDETDDSHPLFSFEANWFPYKDPKVGDVGIGVTYVRGENPDEAFAHQAYWQLSIKFRLK